MVITETVIRTTYHQFERLDPRKWFEQRILSDIRAHDPFQNHAPCWMNDKEHNEFVRRVKNVDND
jgi:hypothetical protein